MLERARLISLMQMKRAGRKGEGKCSLSVCGGPARSRGGLLDRHFLPIRASAVRGLPGNFGELEGFSADTDFKANSHMHTHTQIDADDAECEWAAARLSETELSLPKHCFRRLKNL